jgi:hypothetical protein
MVDRIAASAKGGEEAEECRLSVSFDTRRRHDCGGFLRKKKADTKTSPTTTTAQVRKNTT